jgi:hypothetical protein
MLLKAANDATHIVEVCQACSRRTSMQSLPRSRFTEAEIALMRAWSDNVQPDQRCEVQGCINRGVEWHHWAPQHLAGQFAAPTRWPLGLLCRHHHAEWHRVVTPNMCRGMEPIGPVVERVLRSLPVD